MDERRIVVVSIILTTLFHGVHCSTLTDIAKLHADLLTGYDKNIRPPMDQSVVVISSTFNLVSIRDFNEVTGKFSVTGAYIGTWIDDRLRWDPSNYNGVQSTVIAHTYVWTPSIFLANVYEAVKKIGHDFVTVRLYPNGLVVWTPPDLLTTTCSVDVTNFPFDKQNCSLEIVSFGVLPSEVLLNASTKTAMAPYYSEHGTWELTGTALDSYAFDTGSMFSVHIYIKRRPLFFLVNIIFPVLFLTLLNSFVFLLPVEAGERMSYAITVLLAIAVFMTVISSYLPNTSQTMSRLCYFLVGDLVLSSVICILAIFQMRIYFKSDDRYPVPQYLQKMMNMCKGKNRVIEVKPHISEPEKEVSGNKDLAFVKFGTSDDVTWKDIAKTFDYICLFGSLGIQLFMIVVLFSILA